MVDTKRLRELANAATPGPWTSDMDMFNSDEGIVACVTNETVSLLAKLETGIVIPLADRWAESDSARRDQCWLDAHATQEQKDAAFIAAASPDVVLLLLDRIDALESGHVWAVEAQLADVAETLGKERLEAADGYHGTAVRALVDRIDALEAEKAGIEHLERRAEQLDIARDQVVAENERLKEFIAASEEVAAANDVLYYADENERMRAAFQQMIETLKAGGEFRLSLSGCEWCHKVWPKPEGSTVEQAEERARRHVYACTAHPMRIERDALRAQLDAVAAARDKACTMAEQLVESCRDLDSGLDEEYDEYTEAISTLRTAGTKEQT